ncbi:hypothetical protein TCON_0799 [Astathelohania contejeani]|uniref:Uncharacterized protein n=1 Tax=Astathelohania contejeani TaxID=164912 RepID=A0ABQ7I0N8_9MICR|nr:hypothetical protein TCON_0799 [Thelohania contejeani]
MKNHEKKELERFYDLVKFKDYTKLVKALNVINNIDVNLVHVEESKLLEDFKKHREMLETILRNDVKLLICNKKHIPEDYVFVILLLGNRFLIEMKTTIVEGIVQKYKEEFQKMLDINYKGFGFIQHCIEWIEHTLDKIRFEYSHIPSEWNLEGEFIFKTCILLKQKISDTMFTFEFENHQYLKALYKVLQFEQRYTRYLFSKTCCENDNAIPKPKRIIFNSDTINLIEEEKTSIVVDGNEFVGLENDNSKRSLKKNKFSAFCEHKKMLSKMFLPFIEIYINDMFSKINLEFNQEKEEMKILVIFINLFQEIGSIYSQLNYFNDITSYQHLIEHTDTLLFQHISQINVKCTFHQAAILANTLNFIEMTTTDLLEKISQRSGRTYHMKIFKVVRGLEKKIYFVIENHFKLFFSKFTFKIDYNITDQIIEYLNNEILNTGLKELTSDVLSSIFEIFVALLFCKLLFLKMNPFKAEILLFEICEIERMLKKQQIEIPFLMVIGKYLKIFMFDCNETEGFVENFLTLSNGIFSFSQILTVLEDKSNNVNLFVVYKKMADRSKGFGQLNQNV